jgi:tryptophan 2,3-dioxygenase
MPYTYGSYLRLDELLNLQTPATAGAEHDEMLFIVIHQVYELWFKQVLHETDQLRRALESGDRPVAMAALKRILTIFKTLVAQVDILETMTPVSFAAFRDRLDSASGFQSFQFRELEFVLGHRRPETVQRFEPGTPERVRLEEHLARPSLYTSFLAFLARQGHAIPEEALAGGTPAPIEHEAVRTALIDIYHHHPSDRDLCERLVDLDEGIQEWRYRHVKMVQRTIGMKRGTGGSAGVEYLKGTLFNPLFPDLWAIRAEL